MLPQRILKRNDDPSTFGNLDEKIGFQRKFE
jgi:hypothetical protein